MRTLTRSLRVVALVPWTLAVITLVRSGELDGSLWWGVYLGFYAVVLLAETGRKAAERRQIERRHIEPGEPAHA